MSAEEELGTYKMMARKRARIAAMVYGLLAISCLILLIYGLTQGIEAGRQRDLAEKMRTQMIQCEETAVRQQRQIEQALIQAEEAVKRAQAIAVEAARKK